MNSLSVSPNDYKFTILSAKLLWIYSSFWRIHFELTVFPAKYYEYTIYCELTIDPLSFQRIHCEFTISYVNSLWIHNLCREFTIESLSSRRIHDEFIIFLVNSEFIYYFFREATIYPLFFSPISLLFREITLNSLSISQIYYEFTLFPRLTIFVAQTLTIHYLCRELTMNSSWIHYRVRLLLICYANLLWFHDHFEFTFNFAN